MTLRSRSQTTFLNALFGEGTQVDGSPSKTIIRKHPLSFPWFYADADISVVDGVDSVYGFRLTAEWQMRMMRMMKQYPPDVMKIFVDRRTHPPACRDY